MKESSLYPATIECADGILFMVADNKRQLRSFLREWGLTLDKFELVVWGGKRWFFRRRPRA